MRPFPLSHADSCRRDAIARVLPRFRSLGRIFARLLLIGTSTTLLGSLVFARTFVVDDRADAVDATPGDGVCASAPGTCTLRRTHALRPGSPAIDAIPPAECTWEHDGDPLTRDRRIRSDQRGAPRPQGPGCDIGAFERRCSRTRGAADRACPMPPILPTHGQGRRSCGIGYGLALLVPVLAWWDRRRRSAQSASG